MYCPSCGIHHTDDAEVCSLCRTPLTGTTKKPDSKIFTDLTLFPYRAILKSFKGVHPIVGILLIPIMSLLWAIHKITHTRFLSPILNSKTPKYHFVPVEQKSKIHPSVERMLTYLTQQGFEPLTELEDMSLIQKNYQRLMVHPHRQVYATMHINKMTQTVWYVSFYAFMSNNTYISVHNTYAVPIQYPPNLITYYFPEVTVETLYDQFCEMLENRSAQPILLTLKLVLVNGYKIRQYSIEQGLAQGVLHTQGGSVAGASGCYYHPFNAAVRVCAECGTPLCEGCYTARGDQVFCERCLKQSDIPPPLVPGIPQIDGRQFAGFGVRAAASMMDAGLIAALIAAGYWGFDMVVNGLSSDKAWTSVPLILTQMWGIGLIVAYLIIPIHRFGATVGQKVWGLKVTDQNGDLPHLTAAIVRFAYHLIACLFVIPIAGYFFILWTKTKQGLHDRLAETFVTTRNAGKKTALSWMFLMTALSISGWYVYQGIISWLPFELVLPDKLHMEITLPAQWVENFDNQSSILRSYSLRGSRFFISTTTSIREIDMLTGKPIWTSSNLDSPIIQYSSHDTRSPMLVTEHPLNRPWSLLNVNPATGAVIWKITPDIDYPNIIADETTMLLYNEHMLQAYDADGTLLWQKRFPENPALEYVALNRDILIKRGSDQAHTLTYVSRATGEILWEMLNTAYHPAYAIGNGYHCLISNEGGLLLMYLPENQRVWESKHPRAGMVAGHEGMPFSNGYEAVSYLYSSTCAIRGEDGTLRFTYPPQTRLGCLTHDWLVLLKDIKPNSADHILIADKRTGSEIKQFPIPPLSAIRYLSETATEIYLLGEFRGKIGGTYQASSYLVQIHKQRLEAEITAIGNHINAYGIAVLPEHQLIFIPTYEHIGAYRITKPP